MVPALQRAGRHLARVVGDQREGLWMGHELSHAQTQPLTLLKMGAAQPRRARGPLPTAADHQAWANVMVGTFTGGKQGHLVPGPVPAARAGADSRHTRIHS